MMNIPHLCKFLRRFTIVDPNEGVALPDLLAFYNSFCSKQNMDCTISANNFRAIFEMYLACTVRSFNNYRIDNGTGRTPIVKGLTVKEGNATKFMHLIKFSLVGQNNFNSVRSFDSNFHQLILQWNQAEQVAQSEFLNPQQEADIDLEKLEISELQNILERKMKEEAIPKGSSS